MNQPDKTQNIEQLLHLAIGAAIEAGKAIMSVYNSSYEIEKKSDTSPLTIADKNAHAVIFDILTTTNIPILSEEGEKIPFEVRKSWDFLWIVDPLDGTKEFIKHNDEFTVNIALIHNNKPIIGVVFCPPLNTLYFAGSTVKGAFKLTLNDQKFTNPVELLKNAKKLPVLNEESCFTVVASRSHLNEETNEFIKSLQGYHKDIQLISKGSSLKFCLVAEGLADIYPRFAPTFEWDTAAAQAIVEFSGGKVVNVATNSPLIYNKENLLNPSFTVKRKS